MLTAFGTMATGVIGINIYLMEGRYKAIESHLAGIELHLQGVGDTVNRKLKGVESQLKGIEGQLKGFDSRFDAIHGQLKRIGVNSEVVLSMERLKQDGRFGV